MSIDAIAPIRAAAGLKLKPRQLASGSGVSLATRSGLGTTGVVEPDPWGEAGRPLLRALLPRRFTTQTHDNGRYRSNGESGISAADLTEINAEYGRRGRAAVRPR